VDVAFARSPEDILRQARENKPSLVLFDLNSAKSEPVATIGAIRADTEIASVRILGFASHVHLGLIEAARQAGADDVLPRSAFAARLPEILRGA
jgi:DNA-binding NarL/FixJ family response regulator